MAGVQFGETFVATGSFNALVAAAEGNDEKKQALIDNFSDYEGLISDSIMDLRAADIKWQGHPYKGVFWAHLGSMLAYLTTAAASLIRLISNLFVMIASAPFSFFSNDGSRTFNIHLKGMMDNSLGLVVGLVGTASPQLASFVMDKVVWKIIEDRGQKS